jgi:hypothetical protein
MERTMIITIEQHLRDFRDATRDIEDREGGISKSEGLLFGALCRELNVEIVLESGMGNGVSTEIWANFLHLPVISVDDRSLEYDYDSTVDRLRSKVTMIQYDSFKVFPVLLKHWDGRDVALFIDGPKEADAIKLIDMLDKTNVKLIGIHDVTNAGMTILCHEWAEQNGYNIYMSNNPEYMDWFGGEQNGLAVFYKGEDYARNHCT